MGFADFDIMGKCKKILSAVSELSVDVGEKISTVKTAVDTLAANWTATRAGYLDNIRSYTITNNTGSLTGVLSAKSTYIANSLIGAVNNTGGTYNSGSVHAKLATLIMNDPTTQFVPGTGITKYNPVTAAIGMTTNSNDYVYHTVGDTDFYCYKFRNPEYSFTANRSGSVRLTAKGTGYSTSQSTYVLVTKRDDNDIRIALLYFASSTASTKTVDFDVAKGTTYEIFVGKDSISRIGDVSQIKISYDVITNTSLL